MKTISTAVLIVLFGVGVMTMIVALTGCSTTQPAHKPHPYSGDHTVGQIRGMFSVCYQTRRGVAPHFPDQMHIQHCDCLVDKSREKYSSQDYDGLDKGILADFFRDASIECNFKLGMPPINNNEPAKPDPAML
jgi:hypothetical protein